MDILNTLIKFENENTSLDFKLEEYSKHKTVNLIKDVMSMANADLQGDKYIIIGTKPDTTGRNIVGIDTLTDSASLQQTIIDNVEPEINLDYLPHRHEGKLLGIIKITKCDNRPYLMKKDFLTQNGSLRRGEGYIRMGTTQMRLFRSQYEQIYAQRYQSNRFSGEVNLSFIREDIILEWNVVAKKFERESLPSSLQARKIEKIIDYKVKQLNEHNRHGLNRTEDYIDPMTMMRNVHFRSMGGGTAYEDRSITSLRETLKKITKTYRDEDYYFLLEKKSEKLNVFIKNMGTSYLKAVKIVITIPKHDSILLADELPKNPDNKYPVINSGYPFVEDFKDYYEISEDIGDLKQQLIVKAFSEPVRIFFGAKDSVDFELDIRLELFAANLDEPISKELKIKVNNSQFNDNNN